MTFVAVYALSTVSYDADDSFIDMYFVLYFIIVIFYVFFIQHSMLLNLNVSYRKYIYVILVWYVWYVCPTLYEEWDAVPLTCQ